MGITLATASLDLLALDNLVAHAYPCVRAHNYCVKLLPTAAGGSERAAERATCSTPVVLHVQNAGGLVRATNGDCTTMMTGCASARLRTWKSPTADSPRPARLPEAMPPNTTALSAEAQRALIVSLAFPAERGTVMKTSCFSEHGGCAGTEAWGSK